MAAQEIPLAGFRSKLLGRSNIAEGTMAFHFAKPSGFSFKAGQAPDLTLVNPPETDSEGNIKAAIDEGVPAPVLSVALYERFSSRGHADFADRVLSAMRHEFGGHVEKAA